MAVKKISAIVVQNQLYSTICQVKILAHAFDAVWTDGIGEDEANGFTEGFSEVVDTLEDVFRKLDDFKEPANLNTLAKVVHMQS